MTFALVALIAATLGGELSRGGVQVEQEPTFRGLASVSVDAQNSWKVNLPADLFARVEKGELSADEAAQIESELSVRRDMSYHIPQSSEQLKIDIGFPRHVSLDPEDYVDLLEVHIQMSMGVSPLSAEYLMERMGIRSKAKNQIAQFKSAL